MTLPGQTEWARTMRESPDTELRRLGVTMGELGIALIEAHMKIHGECPGCVTCTEAAELLDLIEFGAQDIVTNLQVRAL